MTPPAPAPHAGGHPNSGGAGQIDAEGVCAWFSGRLVLESVTLPMERSKVTALIGPSGCGKSTFLRILNRMHEVIPGAQLAGSVALDGVDIYGPGQRAVDTRRHIGMVFQKPNPFPAMTIADNVLSGLKFSRVSPRNRSELVEEMLTKAGLWKEVKDRLGELGGALSGGQQQRLCIARSLAVRPRVLLMDEPCSALDPDLHPAHRTHHQGDRPGGHRGHRHPQHATGPAGVRLLRVLSGRGEPAGSSGGVRDHRDDVRRPLRSEDGRLCQWPIRLTGASG